MAIFLHQASADCVAGNEELQESASPNDAAGFYIDKKNPIPCTGQLTQWHYCYYQPFNNRRVDYDIQFNVWRWDSQNMYTKVGEEEVEVRVRRRRNGFVCDDIELEESEYIDVQRGDFLGVVLETPTLPIAARHNSSFILHADVTDGALQSVSPRSNIANQALHITATISCLTECISKK